MSFKVEVLAGNPGEWVGNALRFTKRVEAVHYGTNLFQRWTSVRQWRVKVSREPVNYGWAPGKGAEPLAQKEA